MIAEVRRFEVLMTAEELTITRDALDEMANDLAEMGDDYQSSLARGVMQRIEKIEQTRVYPH